MTHEHVFTSIGDYGIVLDRHHGVEINRLPHPDVTICVGNPHAQGTTLTGGEDGLINIWN